ncbi:hypothetical protein AYI70_g4922 [Smittium culicis]|uniref:Uncharacterized protein n=1 Tax=Smittium culicis TaxID=133412 RepID=A0A1R1XWZ5_9FUNG|nr:hypothetical protein AYI70_g4922 [Smittium culicis]
MEQANTQAPMSQEQLIMLIEMVQQLFRERNREQEPEDPHVKTRISVTDLTSCPALTEALPSIEEDFFRSPLTEEERKIAVHSCPRTSSMNYTPPPLNDTASSTVKKTDSTLYGIQLALAQATRPIDYYFHRRIQENPGMDTAEDTEILFASTMRALLADIAAIVTQARLDNLHKGPDLHGKPTQLPRSQQLKDSEPSPFASASRVRHQRNCTAVTLLRRRTPQLKPPLKSIIEPLTASLIFAEEGAVTGGGLSRGSTRVPSRGPSRYVQISMVQTDGQPMGSEHSVEGIQNPLYELKISDIESVIGKNEKSVWSEKLAAEGGRFCANINRLFFFSDDGFGVGQGADAPSPRDGPYRPITDVSPASVQTEAELGGQRSSDEGSRIITDEASHRRNPTTGSRILQPTFHDPEEDWRPPTCSRPPEPESSCGRAELQDGDADVDMQNDPSEGLSDVTRPPGCFHAHYGLQAVSKVPPLSLRVPKEHALNIFQAFAACIQGQSREVIDHAISADHPFRNGNQLKGNDPQGSIQQDCHEPIMAYGINHVPCVLVIKKYDY